MRTVKVPMTLFAVQAGGLVRVGSTAVEVIEWTHHDGSRTVLVPFHTSGGGSRG